MSSPRRRSVVSRFSRSPQKSQDDDYDEQDARIYDLEEKCKSLRNQLDTITTREAKVSGMHTSLKGAYDNLVRRFEEKTKEATKYQSLYEKERANVTSLVLEGVGKDPDIVGLTEKLEEAQKENLRLQAHVHKLRLESVGKASILDMANIDKTREIDPDLDDSLILLKKIKKRLVWSNKLLAGGGFTTRGVNTTVTDPEPKCPTSRPIEPRTSSEPIKKALVIAMQYANGEHPLNGTIDDQKTMIELLKKLKYKESNILAINDEGTGGNLAKNVDGEVAKRLQRSIPTKEIILDALHWLVDNAIKGDQLFVHFAGHGTQIRDTDGDEYDNMDECIVTADNQALVDDTIYAELVCRVPEGARLTIVFDCCHSGSAADLPYEYRGDGKTSSGGIQNMKAPIKGKIISLSGCLDKQTSVEISGQGIVTQSLRHVLCSYWDSGEYDQKDLMHLYTDVRQKMQELMNDFKGMPSHQVPVLAFSEDHMDLEKINVNYFF